MARNLRVRLYAAMGVAGLLLLPARQAGATTYVGGYITSNTVWTKAAGPYVASSTIVNPGVTLTIEPGTIVKFASTFATLRVYGTLTAIGNPNDRIVFTSLADDSVGGDTGGNGASTGAKGQWSSVVVSGYGVIWYADFKFGGYGWPSHSYGVLDVSPNALADVDHCRFEHNETSGVIFENASAGTVANSEFRDNGSGVSMYNSNVQLSSLVIENNTMIGVFMNYTDSYTGAAPSLLDSDVRNNSYAGIYLQVYSSVQVSSQPVGHRNNIHANGNGVPARQLFTLYLLTSADWSNNYWGEIVDPIPCPWAPLTTTGFHLATEEGDPEYEDDPPPGPVTSYTYQIVLGGQVKQCASDWIKNLEPARSLFDHSGQ